ncbi:hypothetical protein HU200_050570 [Digitaria exilis]|uniref:Uncharacterized protein n=1 Tax=Digitaria exilis TaxID=1010633 RepID=A0A835AX87_9POAL|nr:hypothetical protein HU200_050570 [Digitaria exilis]CAB3446238.1 unnamed protein product [Digitaria exilis]
MASSSAQPDHSHHRDAKHRRPQFHHLNVEVPSAVATTNVGCFPSCFRPSPTSSSSPSPHAGSGSAHGSYGNTTTDRPASPSLIRSPSAWIKAKGHSFGSGKHLRRRSRDFQYDALSYARNFDGGGAADGEGDEEAGLAASDALKHRGFTSRLPTSPPPAIGSLSGSTIGGGGNGGAMEIARKTGRDMN